MVRVLHVSDIHLGSGLNYGRINPLSGMNTRLEDFVQSLKRCIDTAIEEEVDLVLFGGDAFPDATPPPLHQDLFAQQFRRLSDAQIPTVLLVGNHDQYGQGQEGSSLSIYRTLKVMGFYVGDRLQTHRIETQSGPVHVTTLPWLTRSALLTRQDTLGLSAGLVSMQLLQRLHLALEAENRQLDPNIPAILLVHAMVDTATYGAERHLAVGKGFTVPLSLLTRSGYHYVALGHVHKHQVLSTDPLVIYPGSLERVDFGEEHETKGFVLATVEKTGASYQFVALPTRTFKTIRVDVTDLPRVTSPSDPTPQHKILQAIQQTNCEQAIVRIFYTIRPDQLDTLDEQVFHQALATAFSYSIVPDVISATRTRLPVLDPTHIEPLQALNYYLDSRPDLSSLKDDMVKSAQQLLQTQAVESASEVSDRCPDAEFPLEQQLRLL